MHRLHFSVMQSYDVSPRRKALNKDNDNDEDTDGDIGENLALMSQRVPRGLTYVGTRVDLRARFYATEGYFPVGAFIIIIGVIIGDFA